MSTQTSATRIEVIEPLRGLAALAVAWFHFTNGGTLVPAGSWLQRSGVDGWLGVEVFFVISGFIIPYSMYRGGYRFPRDAGRFVLKRILRLDPPYLAALVLTIALWYASALVPGFRGQMPTLTAPQVLAHLGYLNTFLGYDWISPVFWTLAIEFQYYLLAAVGFTALADERPAVRLAALAALAGTMFAGAGDAFVFHYAGLFALGGATFHRRSGLMGDAVYLTVVAALTGVTSVAIGPLVGSVGAATALVIAYARVPRVPVLSWLGAVSYSVYLLHVPTGGRVANLGSRFAGDSVALQLLVLAAAVGASLVAAVVMYRLVERPAQRWSSSIRYVRGVPAPVPAALQRDSRWVRSRAVR